MNDSTVGSLKRTARKRVGKTAQKRYILVVDDEETVGVGMTEMLREAGYVADYVTNGDDAVREITRRPYSLVFMDIVMPGMDGLEAFRRIKELKGNVNVVLFTGLFREADKVIFEGIKEGMIDEFIRKPFFFEEILKTAEKYA